MASQMVVVSDNVEHQFPLEVRAMIPKTSHESVQALLVVSEIEPAGRKDSIARAAFVAPSSMRIRYADGLEGSWTFEKLDLDMSNMKWDTIRASSDGGSVEVESKYGEIVQLDSSALRAVTDPDYAAEINSRIGAMLNYQ